MTSFTNQARSTVNAGDRVVFTRDILTGRAVIPADDRGVVVHVDEDGVVLRLHRYYEVLRNCRNMICLNAGQVADCLRVNPPLLSFGA